jgi:hypothetical protein
MQLKIGQWFSLNIEGWREDRRAERGSQTIKHLCLPP